MDIKTKTQKQNKNNSFPYLPQTEPVSQDKSAISFALEAN